MKSRRWVAGLLLAGLFGSLFVNYILLQQLRSRYESQLIQQIWPAGTTRQPAASGDTNHLCPVVLLLGDSRISEWNPPMMTNYHVINAGIPGATTARLRLQAPELLEQFHPAIVVIQAGINDLKLIGLRPELASLLISEAATNLTELVEICSRQNCKVLLLETWPTSRPRLLRRFIWNQAVPDSIMKLNQQLRKLNAPARAIRVADIISEAGRNNQGVLPYRDAIHFRPDAYHLLNPILKEELKKLDLNRD